jgi:PAS domain S-box-containing protein
MKGLLMSSMSPTPDEAIRPGPHGADHISYLATVEELRTAEEELRQQNEALDAAAHDLRAERQRYQDLFDFAPDCYVVTDADGLIRDANRAAADLFGVRRPYLTGKPLRVFVTLDRRVAFDALVSRLGRGELIRGEETELLQRGGVPLPASVYAAPEYDSHGRVVGLRWLMHDLTALKASQQRAVEAERLAAVGRTVAALAHESRNALQRSQACLRLLALEVQDRPAALDYLQRAQMANESLHRLMGDVGASVGPLRLEFRSCRLRGVWREAWEHLASVWQDRECRLVEAPGGPDPVCPADPFRLEQVFRNVFDNALAAATDPVRILVRTADAWLDGRPAVRVAVEDNGPGLTDVQRDRLFEPFFTTKAHGMGLGLAIVRRIIEAHGGTIAAADADAGGAAILITLPRGDV